MDPILKEKLEAAMTVEINKALENSTIDDNDADNLSQDFIQLLDTYTSQEQFIEEFASLINAYPFITTVADYYMNLIEMSTANEEIDTVRKQIQSFT